MYASSKKAGAHRRYSPCASRLALAICVTASLALAIAIPMPAAAISLEVAKKCNALVAKQFPPREPGNPAAGSTNGSAGSQRLYFNKCVANNGTMDDNKTPPADKGAK